jgi:FkbM family methyltransferase
MLHGVYFVRKRRGIHYLIDINNHIDRQIEAWGAYESDRIERFISEAKGRNCDLFIDIGANLGVYTLAMARSSQDIAIIAFEPDRQNYAQLHANLFLNGFHDRVTVHDLAVSDRTETLRFHRHAAENRGRSGVNANGELQVRAVSMDEFMPLTGHRLAIKIDVEGHELNALKGMSNLLARNTCLLQLEAFKPPEVTLYLEQLGYLPVWRSGNDYIFARMQNPAAAVPHNTADFFGTIG